MRSTAEARPHLDTAVVLGAGLAGLAAARVLADHFRSVLLVERDRWEPDAALPRRGVPQGRHQHLLLAAGHRGLQRLFPCVDADLLAAGGQRIDLARDVGWLTTEGWAKRVPSDLVTIAASRALLESCVRTRLLRHPHIQLLDGCGASGLVLDDATGCVRAVRINGDGQKREELVVPAGLVVDATGRGSRAPRWLEELGFLPPAESVIDAKLAYASRVYRLRRPLPQGLSGALVRGAPPGLTRGGIIMPIEGGETIVTLVGMGGDTPPTDEEGFLAFALSLRSSIIHDAIRDAVARSSIAGSRATHNRWRHYERLQRPLDGLVVLGDASCAFNPAFQQGMTSAVLGALTLDRCLSAHRTMMDGDIRGLAARFHRALARRHRVPWALATATDLRVTGAGDGRTRGALSLRQRYLTRVAGLGVRSSRARVAFLEVLNLVRSPWRLLLPPIALQVMLDGVVRPNRTGPARAGSPGGPVGLSPRTTEEQALGIADATP
jgi:2-polyprenyl-6-methoxyphenol hydroxylase-like FAD-dependent oxidoreductase